VRLRWPTRKLPAGSQAAKAVLARLCERKLFKRISVADRSFSASVQKSTTTCRPNQTGAKAAWQGAGRRQVRFQPSRKARYRPVLTSYAIKARRRLESPSRPLPPSSTRAQAQASSGNREPRAAKPSAPLHIRIGAQAEVQSRHACSWASPHQQAPLDARDSAHTPRHPCNTASQSWRIARECLRFSASSSTMPRPSEDQAKPPSARPRHRLLRAMMRRWPRNSSSRIDRAMFQPRRRPA